MCVTHKYCYRNLIFLIFTGLANHDVFIFHFHLESNEEISTIFSPFYRDKKKGPTDHLKIAFFRKI